MPREITRKENDAGDVEYTETDKNMLESVTSAAILPVSAFGSSNEFISKPVAGMACIAFGAGGFAAGDKFGDEVPILGQRR